MNKIINKQINNENNLILLWQTKNNSSAFIEMLYRYKPCLINQSRIWQKRLQNIKTELDYSEILSLCVITFYNAMNTFKCVIGNNQKKFSSYLINMIKYEIVKEIRKWCSKKNKINAAMNFVDLTILNQFSGINQNSLKQNEDQEEKSKYINLAIRIYLEDKPKIYQKYVYLKSLGKSSSEISKITNLPIEKVYYIGSKIKIGLKKTLERYKIYV